MLYYYQILIKLRRVNRMTTLNIIETHLYIKENKMKQLRENPSRNIKHIAKLNIEIHLLKQLVKENKSMEWDD